jgi:hypothetical protein
LLILGFCLFVWFWSHVGGGGDDEQIKQQRGLEGVSLGNGLLDRDNTKQNPTKADE